MPLWMIPLLVLAAIAFVPVAIGAFLPRRHQAIRHMRLRRPRAEVWSRVADLEAQPAWRDDLSAVTREPDRDGHAVWREEGRNALTFETVAADAPHRLVRRIVSTGPFGGQWTIALADDGTGTLVSITEDGEVYSPLFRFASRFVLGHTRTIDGYLRMLARSFDEPDAAPFGPDTGSGQAGTG